MQENMFQLKQIFIITGLKSLYSNINKTNYVLVVVHVCFATSCDVYPMFVMCVQRESTRRVWATTQRSGQRQTRCCHHWPMRPSASHSAVTVATAQHHRPPTSCSTRPVVLHLLLATVLVWQHFHFHCSYSYIDIDTKQMAQESYKSIQNHRVDPKNCISPLKCVIKA